MAEIYDETIIGFDGAGDDTSLVVMHRRSDGSWRVESADGPDAAEVARMAAGIVERAPRTAEPPEWARTPVRWGDLVAEWLDAHVEGPFELEEWQRDVLLRLYENPGHPIGRLGPHLTAARRS